MGGVGIIWFRHGLRIHDNPALMYLLDTVDVVYPVFIFDGEVAGTTLCGYNRWRFLYQSLQDLERQFVQQGGFFYTFQGKPTEIFAKIIKEWEVTHVAFEQDPEPVWQERDTSVKDLCDKMNVEWKEAVSHTLWNPYEVIDENGGKPPITFAGFQEIVQSMGQPERPTPTPDFRKVKLAVLPNSQKLYGLPAFEKIGPAIETELQKKNIWRGGELIGLELLEGRMEHEIKAFKEGTCLPNQYTPNLVDAPMSLSPYLRFGCVSVRLFYWRVTDAFNKFKNDKLLDKGINEASVSVQLIWREFFYTMSVNNINFSKMKDNPICLQIAWKEDPVMLKSWKMGQTGYPWIDACMRQLRHEGWMHQVGRHAVTCFLTRGDLWISWEDGLQVFYEWLLDADWSICAGNWMWISSSAFEKFLSCPNCFCPVRYGQRMDPSGKFVRRWVPEIARYPDCYLFEPWKAPREVQEKAKCIVGKDYPEVIVEHKSAAAYNNEKMKSISQFLQEQNVALRSYCAPSDEREIREFSWLPDDDDDLTDEEDLEECEQYHTVTVKVL
ncbi:cryptochrome-1-like [Amphiura filiformis]|uniref:cryptochrome-1-like n=1 Tax=Amphiura filiformis TaxID=82378 RepID=UPI003B21ACF1